MDVLQYYNSKKLFFKLSGAGNSKNYEKQIVTIDNITNRLTYHTNYYPHCLITNSPTPQNTGSV